LSRKLCLRRHQRAAAPAQILFTGGANNITINDISGTDRKRAFRER
jgi:hypothetical protein